MKRERHTYECPSCGHKGLRQQPYCFVCLQDGTNNSRKFWTPDRVTILKELYPNHGCDYVAEVLDSTPSAVRNKANKLGVKLKKEVYRERVHDAAGRFMKQNNPMYKEKNKQKAREFFKDVKMRAKAAKTRAKERGDNPPATESFVKYALSVLKKRFIHQFVIEQYAYTCDFLIGEDLILEIDGEYWHGHPSFKPYTDRQNKQILHDQTKDKRLKSLGFKVLRVWEKDVSINNLKTLIDQK